MITISQLVEDALNRDDVALAAAQKGWLNLSAYARVIQPEIREKLFKDVQEGSIITALARVVSRLSGNTMPKMDMIQQLAIHANLEGMTFERSETISERIRDMYHRTKVANKAYVTVTQGINEITVIAEASIAQVFRKELQTAETLYDKTDLVGITVKFDQGYLEVPNMIFASVRRLAYKNINIIEIVSTATELTFIIDRKDLADAFGELQKDI